MAAVMATTLSFESASLVRVFGEDFGVSFLPGNLGLASLRVIRAEAVEFFLRIDGGLEAAAFLGDGVQDYGSVLGLEELEGFDQELQVVAVDRVRSS